MYVLDTNTLIYFFKGMGQVAQTLLAHSPQEIAIPTVVLFELEVGIAKSTSPQKRRQQLAEMMSIIRVFPFGLPESKTAAKIRVTLEKKGTPIGPYDILIAATALANQAVLVTHNTKEYGRIPKLQIEDWY